MSVRIGRDMNAEVVLVGDELLSGERGDKHLVFLARALRRVGLRVGRSTTIRDDIEEIAAIVRGRTGKCAVLIICGGLGPTADDVTREGVAKGLNTALVLNKTQEAKVRALLRRRGHAIRPGMERQAYLPKGAHAISNKLGTAPGFYIEKSGSMVVVLPGPPREMRPMFEKSVLPVLKRKFKSAGLFMMTLRTAGITESALSDVISPLYAKFDMFKFSSLPEHGCVDIVITGKPGMDDTEMLGRFALSLARDMKKLLGSKLYGKNEDTLESVVGGELSKRGETLAVAESLSGGNLGKKLTDVPGSSRYLLADVVAYSNESKVLFLGVDENTLKKHGAVSEQVCLEMARGIRKRCNADWSLATTGIAGPSGGTKAKPVGLCYYGLVWKGGRVIRKQVFPGLREEVRERVTRAALLMLHEKLNGG